MKLLQNGEFVGKVISNVENIDPMPERPLGILTHRSTYTMVLEDGTNVRFSHDAQYAIAEEGKADQSIKIISASDNRVKYRHN
jgi:hypothetical protein